jgi:protein-tyrosine phosphatase
MQRRIDLEGCFNFRDLGGYPTEDGRRVRWRQLFRSDALHHLTPCDVELVTDQLGVRHVVDLRSSGELEAEGRGRLAEAPARFHHLPLFDAVLPGDPSRSFEEITLADRYVMMAELAQEPIARVLATLAESDAPAVYHCAAGKDRTGVISALLLALLGVGDAAIMADYAATQETLDSVIDRLLSAHSYQETLTTLPADTLHAEPETMLRLLEQLRQRYGSVEDYAAKIGLSMPLLEGLRERLLEDA